MEQLAWQELVTAIGALNIDATGTTTLNGDIDASSIVLDGAADVDLATGAITLDTSAANGLVDLTGGAFDGAQDLTITAGSGAVSLGWSWSEHSDRSVGYRHNRSLDLQ